MTPPPGPSPEVTPPPPAPPAAVLQPLPPPPRTPPPPLEVTSEPLRIRVGLATDVGSVDLPGGSELVVGAHQMRLGGPGVLRPDARVRSRPTWRLQVAALKDERQAETLAADLQARGRQPAEATFDAGTDLYRVRWGRFRSREEAEEARGLLATLGVVSAWAVSEGGALEEASLEVVSGERRQVFPGRLLEVRGDADGFEYAGTRHRGEMHVFLNDRGLLNVVAVVGLEDYLRGVVPKEMGPALYPEIEALEAQAIAARTFTLLNLGAFEDEGYDLCSTPRCQVYGGRSVEHPLSDRAIRETAGQVLLRDGRPVETLYSATCGGHTEDVATVFPAKSGAHLRGVPCLEEGSVSVGGGARPGAPFPGAVIRRLLPPSEGTAEQVLTARVEHLSLLAGATLPLSPLATTRRDRVLAWIEGTFAGLPTTAPWADLRSRWREDGTANADPSDADDLLFALATRLGVLEVRRGSFLGVDADRLTYHVGDGTLAADFEGDLPTWRPGPGGRPEAARLELVPGDPIDLLLDRTRLLAVVQPRAMRSVTLARHAARQRWTRTRTHAEVRRRVQERYPGFPFADLEVEARGVSGRIGRVQLVGTDGRRIPVEGLAIRWTLDLPDTLFEWVRTPATGGGEPGWFFRGRGWGHGVGLCQLGSFGMAQRGLTAPEILHHYYGGVELGRVEARRFELSDRPGAARPEQGADGR